MTSVAGESVGELTLSDLPLDISKHIAKIANVAWDDEFAAAVMALTRISVLKTQRKPSVNLQRQYRCGFQH